MHRFQEWPEKWWQKQLVDFGGRPLPAELAILNLERLPNEAGVWMNSRGTNSGVVDLVRSANGSNQQYKTVRTGLPEFVSSTLSRIYRQAGLKKGCPDLLIWDLKDKRIRLIEVKCPHWDSPSGDQGRFLRVARAVGIEAKIVEWEFCE